MSFKTWKDCGACGGTGRKVDAVETSHKHFPLMQVYGSVQVQCPTCEAHFAEVERLKKAVSLLNSMVLSGEMHSDQSRAVVRDALKDGD